MVATNGPFVRARGMEFEAVATATVGTDLWGLVFAAFHQNHTSAAAASATSSHRKAFPERRDLAN